MEVIVKVLAENAFPNGLNNNLNIIGIFDRINADQLPVRLPRLVVVVVLTGGEANTEFVFSFDIKSPSGKKILDSISNPMKVKISDTGRANILYLINNLELSEFGNHVVNLKIGSLKEEKIFFDVAQREGFNFLKT